MLEVLYKTTFVKILKIIYVQIVIDGNVTNEIKEFFRKYISELLTTMIINT